MELCGEAENGLASELIQHEIQIEKEVLDPLNQLAEVSTQVFPSFLFPWTMCCVTVFYTLTFIMYILCQVDIPNILKQRRQLAKLVLDYDSARTRFLYFKIGEDYFHSHHCVIYCQSSGSQ